MTTVESDEEESDSSESDEKCDPSGSEQDSDDGGSVSTKDSQCTEEPFLSNNNVRPGEEAYGTDGNDSDDKSYDGTSSSDESILSEVPTPPATINLPAARG